ncbi:MAG: hypothetical protein ABIL62_18630 [Planctomycetota bacterium]
MYESFHGKDLWVDPINDEAKKGAVLLSDQIAYYVEKVNMISPFDPEAIRPASYVLHVGSEYYIDETPSKLNEGEEIIIPENGLVYVQTREWLNIAYYLIARYNLEVRQLYRGFLLDDGLQIDPGYHGHFYCPIHNLTNQEKKLKYGDRFVVIDFIRTSPFKTTQGIDLNSIDKEKDLLEKDILGICGKPIALFAKGREELIHKDRKVHDYWLKGEKHSSSMRKLQKSFEQLKNKDFPEYRKNIDNICSDAKSTVSTLKIFGIVSLLAICTTFGGILLKHFYWQEGKFSTVNEKYECIKNELNENISTHVENETEVELGLMKEDIANIKLALQNINSQQDVTQDSIKAFQNTVLEFENSLMQMKVDSSKNPKDQKQ